MIKASAPTPSAGEEGVCEVGDGECGRGHHRCSWRDQLSLRRMLERVRFGVFLVGEGRGELSEEAERKMRFSGGSGEAQALSLGAAVGGWLVRERCKRGNVVESVQWQPLLGLS